jgi:hypothetical protein
VKASENGGDSGGGGGGDSGGSSVTFPIAITFDSADAITTLIGDPSDFEGAGSIVKSDAIGGNSGPKLWVGRGTSNSPSAVYAGTVLFTLTAGQLISSSNTTASLKVWSPKAGAVVKFKLEGTGGTVEVDQIVTSANTWETLTFDFSLSSSGELKSGVIYKTAVLMLDFGVAGTGQEFFIDDINFPGSVLAVTSSGKQYVAPSGPPVFIEDSPIYFKPTVKPEAKLTTTAGTFTCVNGTSSVVPTLAVYYLLVDKMLVAGLRYGKFVNTKPLYPFINALTGDSATATSATFTLDKAWNANGHTARLECVIQTGTSYNTQTLKPPAVWLKSVGKYKKFVPFKPVTPSKVTMRLVEPVLKKDAAGKPVDYVDMSASPIKDDNWGQYYGSADGGLGVFYKYLDAGSTTTFKYKVTDSVTKKAVPYYKVWLVVNKNYGGAELASFTYENNGVINVAAPNRGPIGETQFEGRTDINGFVSFTLLNTNTVAEAEPKPAALNAEQPKSVTTNIYSTITLMARLGSDETKETKDFVWAHIVKP